MFLTIAAILLALSVGLDIYVTEKLLRTNPKAEMNPFAQWLRPHLGSYPSAIGAVLLPKMLLIGLCGMTHSAVAFGMLSGASVDHAWKQIYCIRRGLI